MPLNFSVFIPNRGHTYWLVSKNSFIQDMIRAGENSALIGDQPVTSFCGGSLRMVIYWGRCQRVSVGRWEKTEETKREGERAPVSQAEDHANARLHFSTDLGEQGVDPVSLFKTAVGGACASSSPQVLCPPFLTHQDPCPMSPHRQCHLVHQLHLAVHPAQQCCPGCRGPHSC